MAWLSAPLVIAILAVVFLAMGLSRAVRDASLNHPRTRTWLLVGIIFALASAYSWSQI
jgi:hypothetical protein